MLLRSLIPTLLGPMVLLHDGQRLHTAEFAIPADRIDRTIARHIDMAVASETTDAPAGIADAFAAYFNGNVRALEDVPVVLHGSEFQRQVWEALRTIPAGETRSYGDIARMLGGQATGKGGLARAVGLANGSNPLAIVIPCHRVIGADGRLTGYAGGLERKRWLLAHEGWRQGHNPAQESLF